MGSSKKARHAHSGSNKVEGSALRVPDKCVPLTLELTESAVDRTATWKSGDGSAMAWLCTPLSPERVRKLLRKGTPAYINRRQLDCYYEGLYSTAEIQEYLRSGKCLYGYNVDVVRYGNGKRHTYNSNGDTAENCLGAIAEYSSVWNKFQQKDCSVRILHPQQQSTAVWQLMSRLESELLCCVGCNAYLTPAGSQGFAPHYDDIDAFILQLEGSKQWKVYDCADAQLPITLRADYSREELPAPCLEVTLSPGDLLILPRGAVHEAVSLDDAPSLHITLSANQGSTWAALAQEALPQALLRAAALHAELRHSLEPADMAAFGFQARSEDKALALPTALSRPNGSDSITTTRIRQVADRIARAVSDELFEALHVAADGWWEGFMSERLPLYKQRTTGSEEAAAKELAASTRLQMVQPNAARLVAGDISADGKPLTVRVVYGLKNSRSSHARGGSGGRGACLEFDSCWEQPLRLMLSGQPFTMNDLIVDRNDDADKLRRVVVKALVDEGIIRVRPSDEGRSPGRNGPPAAKKRDLKQKLPAYLKKKQQQRMLPARRD